ncbi:hypothetical protein [Microbacterium sp.]|uniref:hypothetical protein n=1 Tax=Microbacterium sp. TaxID=51671 RepID=UPI0039E40E9D
MTEPQSWVLIGIFATIMLGGLTLSTNLIMRTLTTAIGGLHGEMDARFNGLHGEMGSLRGEMGSLRGEMDSLRGEMDARFDGLRTEMNARFDAVNARIDVLDDDIAAIAKRVL